MCTTDEGESPVWICTCEKCGNEVEINNTELSRAIPWPCRKCGESSVYLRKRKDVF